MRGGWGGIRTGDQGAEMGVAEMRGERRREAPREAERFERSSREASEQRHDKDGDGSREAMHVGKIGCRTWSVPVREPRKAAPFMRQSGMSRGQVGARVAQGGEDS